MERLIQIAFWLLANGHELALRNWLCDCSHYVLTRLGIFDQRLIVAIEAGRNLNGQPDAFNQAIAAVWRPGFCDRTLNLQHAEMAAAWCAYPDIEDSVRQIFELTSQYSEHHLSILEESEPQLYARVKEQA